MRDIAGERGRDCCTTRRRWALRAGTFTLAFAYFASGISLREASLLESQDLGIAADLFDTFAITADHSPLHFVFLSWWQRLNLHSLVFLRLPSTLACAFAAVLVLELGALETGAVGGLLSAALFTINPLVVDNARSLRMYAWVVLFCAAGLRCAHAYLCHERRRRHLIGFAWAASLAIYTHLFSWLWVGPLSVLLAFDLLQRDGTDVTARGACKLAGLSLIVLTPQIVHGFFALALTGERHALYAGASADDRFWQTVAQTLCLGENLPPSYALASASLLPIALAAFGVCSLGKPARLACGVIVLPGLALSWALSFRHEVEARYLNYLIPPLALAMGVGIAKASRPLLWTPLAVAVAYVSIDATRAGYAGPPTDWYGAAARIEAIATPADVVAVFPGYWAATLRRYSHRAELIAVSQPIDLERLIERGRPVILVRNQGRYFGHIAELLRARFRTRVLFSTSMRSTLEVMRIEPPRQEPLSIDAANEPALVLAGLVGSGGYPWQRRIDGVRAFARLDPLFASAEAVVTGYDAYDPPWYQALRWGRVGLRQTRPNAEVVAALRTAGVSNVALRCADDVCADATAVLVRDHVRIVPELGRVRTWPNAINVGGVPVRIAYLAAESAVDDRLARQVSEAKRSLPPSGRLVLLVARHGDYARTADTAARTQARALIDAGADVVAGEGGYAAQEVERYRNGLIAYSLGTLLRPRLQSLCASDANGMTLRVRFAKEGGAPSFQMFATSFDDQGRPTLGRAIDIQRLLLPAQDERRASATELLERAEVAWMDESGVPHRLAPFERVPPAAKPLIEPIADWIESVQQWFPLAPRMTRLRPFERGFADGSAYAGVRGVLGLGRFRRAIELDTGGHSSVLVRFPCAVLPGPLSLAYAPPDDRLANKSRPFKPQRLVLRDRSRELWSEEVPYRAGWSVRTIPAAQNRAAASCLELELQSRDTHFPVAVELMTLSAPGAGHDQRPLQ